MIESFDESSFEQHFMNYYQKLSDLEKVKCVSPHFAYALKDLATYYETKSLATSIRTISLKKKLRYKQLNTTNKGHTKSHHKSVDRVNLKKGRINNNNITITINKNFGTKVRDGDYISKSTKTVYSRNMPIHTLEVPKYQYWSINEPVNSLKHSVVNAEYIRRINDCSSETSNYSPLEVIKECQRRKHLNPLKNTMREELSLEEKPLTPSFN